MRSRLAQVMAALSLVVSVASSSPAGLDHSAWNDILHKYVINEARVDYRKLKEHGTAQLDGYLQQLARPWPGGMTAVEQKAALINAYNALTVHWVVENYPVESIWRTHHPFSDARHTLDGKRVSLAQIEDRLRDMDDPRIHAALVCAARSCPPLRREAYEAARIGQQLDDNARAWLANTQANEFFPDRRLASVSMIFDWYAGDFAQSSTPLAEFLARLGPSGKTWFLRQPGARIEYNTYQWGLNDTSSLGSGYSQLRFLWDAMLDKWF